MLFIEDQTIVSHSKISSGKNKKMLLLSTISNVVKVKMENNIENVGYKNSEMKPCQAKVFTE